MRKQKPLSCILGVLIACCLGLATATGVDGSIARDVPAPGTITCLTSPGTPAPAGNPLDSEQTLLQQPVSGDLLCATYFARCVDGGSCSDAEVEAGKWRWVYGSLTDFECKELQAEDMSGNFKTRDLPPAVAPKAYRKVDGVDMCARYKFQCTKGDKTCTAAEIKSRAWKWAYMPLSSSTCVELKTYANKNDAAIKNVLCCSSTNCNRPSPALDPHTKVITNSAAAASLSKPQQGPAQHS
ncbi:hypothetical protein OEZ86_004861 [Tetradesmus obliquus]|uniref:Uncharacterized protein n=1 Tax=Tetradesmus obliquus TaxID=3088 RepID=A0ABY8UHG1_TETOB|nr:hypothetical protein OEZ85_005301 [Tetradesmus obliquus]WIA41253.1 hypothetical protein OEZ86_004861 [Tetradesmus obliquus]